MHLLVEQELVGAYVPIPNAQFRGFGGHLQTALDGFNFVCAVYDVLFEFLGQQAVFFLAGAQFIFGMFAFADIQRRHHAAILPPVFHVVRNDLDGEYVAIPVFMLPPVGTLVGFCVFPNILEQLVFIFLRADVEQGHIQEFIPRVSVAQAGRVVDFHERQRFQFIDPHGQGVALEGNLEHFIRFFVAETEFKFGDALFGNCQFPFQFCFCFFAHELLQNVFAANLPTGTMSRIFVTTQADCLATRFASVHGSPSGLVRFSGLSSTEQGIYPREPRMHE